MAATPFLCNGRYFKAGFWGNRALASLLGSHIILHKVAQGWYLGNSNYINVKGLVKGYLHRSFLATTKMSASFISRLASHWQHRQANLWVVSTHHKRDYVTLNKAVINCLPRFTYHLLQPFHEIRTKMSFYISWHYQLYEDIRLSLYYYKYYR